MDKDKTILVKYPGGKNSTSYNVSNGIKRIEPYAFYKSFKSIACKKIKEMKKKERIS